MTNKQKEARQLLIQILSKSLPKKIASGLHKLDNRSLAVLGDILEHQLAQK